jgi:hypothetical protein
VQAELVHGRWAMLGVAGILFTSIGAAAGLGFPQWYDAGKVAAAGSYASFPNLLISTFLLMGWAEGKRWADIKNPGSQGDGSFFGVTDDFKGKENGYPGGRFFDPMGLSRGSDAQYKKYKENEVRLFSFRCLRDGVFFPSFWSAAAPSSPRLPRAPRRHGGTRDPNTQTQPHAPSHMPARPNITLTA